MSVNEFTRRPVYVIGGGVGLPPREYDNREIGRYLGLPDRKIDKYVRLIGVESRRLCWNLDTGTQEVTNDELAGEAARNALAAAGVDASEVDLVVCGSSVPDYLMPNISSRVLKHLGIDEAIALSHYGGCANFVEAFVTAYSYLSAGLATTAVVTGSEVCSVLTPSFRNGMDTLLFGDGAGAMVLSVLPRESGDFPRYRVADVHLGTRSTVAGEPAELIVLTAGGYRIPNKPGELHDVHDAELAELLRGTGVDVPAEHRLVHNGKQAYAGAVPSLLEAFGRVTKSDPPPGVVVSHHASRTVLKNLAAGLPDGWRLVDNLAHRGNISSASIPVAFCEQLDVVRTGDSVVLAGVGAGLSFGGVLLDPLA